MIDYFEFKSAGISSAAVIETTFPVSKTTKKSRTTIIHHIGHPKSNSEIMKICNYLFLHTESMHKWILLTQFIHIFFNAHESIKTCICMKQGVSS